MPRPRGRPPHDDVLTPAEWRTVHFVRHGLTNRQIAERRGVSEDAVKYHVANIIAKLGVANRRALKTWVGAPRDGHRKRKHVHTTESETVLGLAQVARSVGDIEAAVRWYRDVLGLAHLFTFGELAFFDCGGTRLMLSQTGETPGDESILYLRVADIHAAHERLSGEGVEFINAPHRVHRHEDGAEEWMAFFKDPDGRPLAIQAVTEPVG